MQLMDDLPLDPRPEFHRVHIRVPSSPTSASDGHPYVLRAYSTGGQRSSRIASLAGANGLVACPALDKNAEGAKTILKKGEIAEAVLIGEVQVDV